MAEIKISNNFEGKSTPITVGVDLSYYINTLKELLLSQGGLGLSAPEIGIYQQIFVMNVGFVTDNVQVIINPIIDFVSNKRETLEESCMSCPDKFKAVNRAELIHVQYYNENWELITCYFSGLKARVFQHEYEHLLGKCIFSESTKK